MESFGLVLRPLSWGGPPCVGPAIVREMVERHLRFTGSTLALAMIDDWENARGKFVKVFPHEYRRALTEMHVKRGVKEPAKQRAAA